MSVKVLNRLRAKFGDKILAVDSFCGDDEALVAPADWVEIAKFVRDDPECAMDHFIDITAVDYPEREPGVAALRRAGDGALARGKSPRAFEDCASATDEELGHAHLDLARRRLDRARGLRPVRHSVFGATPICAAS